MKKFYSINLVLLLFLNLVLPYEKIAAAADITKPRLDQVSIDKTEAWVGESVKITVKASDDVKVDSVNISYSMPLTYKSMYVRLTYNEETDAFEGSVDLTDNFESGEYRINYISVRDTANNYILESNRTLTEKGHFRVFTEANPPTFTKLSIDRDQIESEQSINLVVEGDDDTLLKQAVVNYQMPESQTIRSVAFWFGKYNPNRSEQELYITNRDEVGTWKVHSIEMTDINDNQIVVNGENVDLSVGNFSVVREVEPLKDYLVNTSTTIKNETITSDVYISPSANLTIDGNVTIEGNVYVLGGLRSNGGLTVKGNLVAKSISSGSYAPSRQQALLSETDIIQNKIKTDKILTEVPLVIYDTPLIKKDGQLNISGATLPFLNMKINGEAVPLKSNGTFELTNYILGEKESLELVLTDPANQPFSFHYNVAPISIDELTKETTVLKGRTYAHHDVKVFRGEERVGSSKADDNGIFQIPVNGLIENSTLTFRVFSTDQALVAEKDVAVKDTTAPNMPEVNELNNLSAFITGTAEPGATVYVQAWPEVIAQGITDHSGTFRMELGALLPGNYYTIYVEDAAKNRSESVTAYVIDRTIPEPPTVRKVMPGDRAVTGMAELGTKVVVNKDRNTISSERVDSNGNFSVEIDPQDSGTVLEIKVVDTGGNISKTVYVTVGKEVNASFTDVMKSHRFYQEIQYLVNRNVITGFPDGDFRPNATVTRAQAAIMIGRALGLNSEQRNTSFSDVGKSLKASGYIQSAVERGIITGFPDGTYRPDAPVTRGQMAIFIGRAFSLTSEATISFSDVSQGSSSYEYVKRILADGITTGYPDGTFRPNKQLIRSDFSAFMARALDEEYKL
ncbi:S-layer homology domain-containing protein [Cytobacillus spongiae]|uniref:S-layer homology domain-containing protein n=1 Tax=Cytobacillus spongiae TaxID=2901381 RepID=UPI001F39843C|nr:S-layer homology domain-containing protein [Cytobacillus spongiae]UII55651.1 S-layer homology domain-containing protein [Cytobacillus spongiae]